MFVRMNVEMSVVWVMWSPVMPVLLMFVLVCMGFVLCNVITVHNVRRDVMMQEIRKALNSDDPTNEASNENISSCSRGQSTDMQIFFCRRKHPIESGE
jgi:hypothetical protein